MQEVAVSLSALEPKGIALAGRRLNRAPWGEAWRVFYSACYRGLQAIFTIVTRPVFGTRRVGPFPDMPDRGVIICPNHASYLDPLFVQLVTARRVTFVMTNNFYRQAWGLWFFRLVDAIPVGGGRLSRSGMRRAIAHLKRGRSVVIFPEGRLSRDNRRGTGQRGIARVARRSGAPVYPLAIVGSNRAWPPGAIRPGRAQVRVKFAPPLEWTGVPGRGAQQAFADEIMRRIESEHRYIRTHAPSRLDGPLRPARR